MKPAHSFYVNYGKRLADVVAAGGLLIATSPVMLLAAIAIQCSIGSPVIFRQPRAGRNGSVFCCLKFRTMTDDRDTAGTLLPDEKRLTGIGRWLRKLSIDELPQLWNVLRGEMSLIGPRPLLVHYLERYSTQQRRRHEVRPGITGWAQVNGRNAVTWEDRFAKDVWYVDHVSLWLDIRILARTVLAVVMRQGISAADAATMAEFMGTPNAIDAAPPDRSRTGGPGDQ